MRLFLFTVLVTVAGCLFPSMGGSNQQSNQQNMVRLCSEQNYAYEAGYNAGLKRMQLDTTWVDANCAPTWVPTIRERYQTGYNLGIQNAPIVVQNQGGGGGGRSTVILSSTERCTFSSDCGEGRTCRSNQCYGEGYAGDPCVFSSDCVSNDCDLSTKVCE